MKKLTVVALVSLTLAGCAVHKDMIAVGGSKADGAVKMAYEYGPFESPNISEQQGVDSATKKCQAWGYKSAEAFGGSESTCVQPDPTFGCAKTRVTTEYQCTE